MKVKTLSSGLAAAAMVATGTLALAAPAGATVDPATCTTREHWPASAEGRPAVHADAAGVYVWHTTRGWRVRVNDPAATAGDPTVFTGSIAVDGAMLSVGRHLEDGAEGIAKVSRQRIVFRFVNHGGVDGLNFATKCSTTLRVNVRADGVAVSADHVYIGAAGNHPDAVPFSITKTA